MTTITITTSAPPDPATVTEFGDALPELVRALNHQTMHAGALAEPADADRLIRNLAEAVLRLPQLLQQVATRLNREYEDGRLVMTGGEFLQPVLAVMAVEARLQKAGEHAEALRLMLGSAAAVTSNMAVRDDSSEEGTDG